jgi:hypothetical protein
LRYAVTLRGPRGASEVVHVESRQRRRRGREGFQAASHHQRGHAGSGLRSAARRPGNRTPQEGEGQLNGEHDGRGTAPARAEAQSRVRRPVHDQSDQRPQGALQFYRGDNLDLYGDSGAGLSTVVSRDTMEASSRCFRAGQAVRGRRRDGQDGAARPEDEEAAKQATEYLNWRFTRQQRVPGHL